MIVILGRILFLITLGLIAGCTPALGDRGVGQDLYSSQTPRATNNIAAYFGELCNQTNLQRSGTAADCSDYSMLVQAGFNDIDARCDHYLAWIDNKRVEAGRVHSSLVAIGSAATSVLTIASASTDTIAYVAQALGLTGSLYDAFNNSLLMGLESSTIKRIVYERRLEFRRQFVKVNFSTSPDMVFALRGYLRICTPQTIVLDANAYALAVASGVAPQSLAKSIQQEVDAIAAGQAPVTPGTSAGTGIKRGAVVCDACDKLFADKGYTPDRIKAAQTALCVKSDGNPGKSTLMAVTNFRDTQGWERTGLITEPEYSDLMSFGCKSGDLDKGLQNFFEAVTYRDNAEELKQLIANLNLILPATPLPSDSTLKSDALRAKIAEARARYQLGTGDPVNDTRMSRKLKDKIAGEAHKLR